MINVDDCGEDIGRMRAILPCWFIERMTTDEWFFGLLLVTGQVIAVSHIDNVRQASNGSIWLDVRMQESDITDRTCYPALKKWPPILGAPTDRLAASINAAHVVCAFELADT